MHWPTPASLAVRVSQGVGTGVLVAWPSCTWLVCGALGLSCFPPTPNPEALTSNPPLCGCRLQALVDAGPTPPPGETGAKFIIRKDGRRINLAFLRDGASRALEVGWRLRGAARRASEARCAALPSSAQCLTSAACRPDWWTFYNMG